jgi:hypothetical protein
MITTADGAQNREDQMVISCGVHPDSHGAA